MREDERIVWSEEEAGAPRPKGPLPSLPFALARRARIERALRIVMTYAGLAEWRRRDLRRLEVVERRLSPKTPHVVDIVDVEIRLEGVVVYACRCVLAAEPGSTPFDRIETLPNGDRVVPPELESEARERIARTVAGVDATAPPRPRRGPAVRAHFFETWRGRLEALA